MRRAFLVLAAAAPLACSGSWTVLDSGVPGYFPVDAHTCRVARDPVAASYLAAWVRHGADGAAIPAIDFDQDMLVAVLMGPISRLGGSVTVDDVSFQGPNVTLDVTHTPPPPGFLGPAIQIDWRGPWALVRVSRHDGFVRLRRNGGAPVTGSAVTYAEMADEEYAIRRQRFEDFGIAFSLAGEAPSLDTLLCPIDGADALVSTELPATGTYTDLASTEYYCPAHGQYWIRHTQGAFVGTVSYWWGPYTPGAYAAP